MASAPRRCPLLRLALIFPLLLASLAAATDLDKRRLKAKEFEDRGAWLEACRAYDDLYRRDRSRAFAKEGYQRCLRRLHLAVRHADQSYRQTLLRLTPGNAVEAYEQVLTILQVAYPDETRSGYTQLFQQGLEELRLALDDPNFRQHHLPAAKADALAAFKHRLETWQYKRLHSRGEVRDQVLAVIRSAAKDGIPLRPAVLSAMVLEFAAGACNALDEHSSFLSPGNLALVQAAIRGSHVGIGIDVGIDADDRLVVTRVHPKSPAEAAGLLAGDLLLRIDGVPVEHQLADRVAERLRGEPGTEVEVEVSRDGDLARRTIKLARRTVAVPAVEYDLFRLDDGSSVGFLKINFFHETTLQDVKAAIAAMSAMGEPIKGLILDLRGNPGGVFKSAVAVAELFVSGGVIVIGQSQLKEYNKPFRAETGGPLQMPLVVLIDGETASSAEVLAGALREGRPEGTTKLVGQTTYGKGSIQCLIPMDKAPLDRLAGIRVTVAKLFSPTNQPYTGRGVTPHEPSQQKGEGLVLEARKHLLAMLKQVLPAPRMDLAMTDPT